MYIFDSCVLFWQRKEFQIMLSIFYVIFHFLTKWGFWFGFSLFDLVMVISHILSTAMNSLYGEQQGKRQDFCFLHGADTHRIVGVIKNGKFPCRAITICSWGNTS